MKAHARVVVIGGGIVGCSVLYHLTRLGWTDVVLLERDELTSGSTWHAAGNCPNFSTSWSIMKLQSYSNRLYRELPAEVDQAIDHRPSGSIRLAHTNERMEEFRHVAGMAQAQGLGFEIMSANAMRARHPFLETHDILGGLWDPDDGDIDPSQVTQALAKGARAAGATIYRQNPVRAIGRTPSGEWRIETRDGAITCEIAVNAAGYRAREIGRMVGLDLPIVSMEHQYLVTEAIPEIEAHGRPLPLVRDPDVSYYLRQERAGLLLGPYEWDCRLAWDGAEPPAEFGRELFPDDLDRLERYIEDAIARVPIFAHAGITRVVNGPIPYTPDGNPLIGPAYGLDNFYLCCAFSFGIVQAGGAGKAMAEWITAGEPEWDLFGLDPRRYTDYANQAYTRAKACELYQKEYAIAFPFEERPAGRPAKTTPLYETLRAKGAMFGARGGWERATWFAAEGQRPEQRPSFHRTNWHDAVGEECRAVRERVGVMDLGGFAKFEIEGPRAARWLDRLICGRLPKVGRVTLAYLCTPNGGVLSELTITRLAEDRLYLVSAAIAEWHDEQWLRAHLPEDGGVTVRNVTPRYGTLVLAGPLSRAALGRITEADLSNAAFPWLSARSIEIGFARVLALRISYVGELGWELHLPIEHQLPVYQALLTAGADFGIRDFGMYAMDSLRLEKCYPAWKVDLTHEFSPLEASLERFVALHKPDFVGREALLRQRDAGVPQRLVPLVVDTDDVDAPFCARVFAGRERIGLVGSAGYGHTLAQSIALAYVTRELATPGTELEVEIFGARRPAVIATAPLLDPENRRLRG
ncbi:MAG: GcvT family protein [Geminicoccaceae bacterium]